MNQYRSWFLAGLAACSFACEATVGSPHLAADGEGLGHARGPESGDETPNERGPGEEPPEENEVVEEPLPVCADDELPSLETGAAKVKYVLTGLPLSDADRSALVDGRSGLEALVPQWLALPEAEKKLQDFFATTLQQKELEEEGFSAWFGESRVQMGRGLQQRIRDDFEESLPRTAMAIVEAGQPLSDLVTTNTFFMNTAMMVTFAHWDARPIDDAGDASYRGRDELAEMVFHADRTIPREESLDPTSPNFLHFELPELAEKCPDRASVTISRKTPLRLYQVLFGRGQGDNCLNVNFEPVVTDADFEDWRLVTIRTPNPGEATDQFFDLVALREKSELILHTPRVGFFTSPAFLGLWLTNDANSHRVNMNQALIVALGQSFDEEDLFLPAFEDALDDEHAVPGTTCYACHSSLDPMRQFYRQSYTVWYGQQLDEVTKAIPAEFVFGTVQQPGEGVEDLASILADNPDFPEAWAQKLCYAVNSEACPQDSAEFEAVVEAFVQSGLDFRVLATELLSSPLITGAECLEGGTGQLAGISRARHLCSALAARLNMDDACSFNRTVRNLIGSVPDDGFSRATVEPVVIRSDDMFVRSAEEKICRELAVNRIGGEDFPINEPEVSVLRLVTDLMGFTSSHPRHGDVLQLMTEHFENAMAAAQELGENDYRSRRDGLRSAFMVACQSPTVVGMGM